MVNVGPLDRVVEIHSLVNHRAHHDGKNHESCDASHDMRSEQAESGRIITPAAVLLEQFCEGPGDRRHEQWPSVEIIAWPVSIPARVVEEEIGEHPCREHEVVKAKLVPPPFQD